MSAFAVSVASVRRHPQEDSREAFLVKSGVEPLVAYFDYEVGGTAVTAGESRFWLAYKLQSREGEKLVVADFMLQHGTRLLPGFEEVWSGVAGSMLAKQGGTALLKMKNGDSVHIFYPDGAVAHVAVRAANVLRMQLPPKEALAKRLEFIQRKFELANEKQGDDRVRAQDRTFHELAALLRLTALFPEFRKEITGIVGRYTKTTRGEGGGLNPGVRKHFTEALRSLREDPKSYWWLGGQRDTGPTLAETLANKGRKGRPAVEVARKKDRSERERDRRSKLKGPPRNDDSNKRSSGKKNKK